jgi:hypothetical protein
MQRTTRFTIIIAGAAMAGTLALGAVAAADGDASDSRRARLGRLTDEQKCEHRDRITGRAGEIQTRLADLALTLDELRAVAVADGDSAAVERYDRQLERLERVADRVDGRVATFDTWVQVHCTEA